MGYRVGSSELNILYDSMKDAIKQYGIAQFMDIVRDALCSSVNHLVEDKTEDVIMEYKSYKEKVNEMERLLNK